MSETNPPKNPLRLVLQASPPRPRAGQIFTVSVSLLDGAPPETLTITFEKHRIYVDGSGGRELCPIQSEYFEDGGTPQPITIKAPYAGGTTPVQVSARASTTPCPIGDPPGASKDVEFPDQLILTAFVSRRNSEGQQELAARDHLAVTIDPP